MQAVWLINAEQLWRESLILPESRRPESSERSKNSHELVEIICVPISPDLLVVLTHSSSKRISVKESPDSDSSVVKESACNAGDPGSIPGLDRSAGEGIGYACQYSCPCGSAGETWV